VALKIWPLPRLTDEQLAKYEGVAETVELERPADVDETLDPDFTPQPAFFQAEKSPRHRFAWARGMTEMRALQADKTKWCRSANRAWRNFWPN